MKKFISFFGLIIVISFAACNQDNSPDVNQYVEAAFYVNIEDGSFSEDFTKASTGSYERPATTPVYVTGVKITAVNHKLENFDPRTEEFPFADTGGDPITMEVGVGNTDFTAISTTDESPVISNHLHLLTKETSGTLEEKASVYSPTLKSQQPIYVEYATDSIARQYVGFSTTWYNNLLVDDPKDNDPNDDGLTLSEMQKYMYGGSLYYWTRRSGTSLYYFEVWPGFVEFTLTPQLGRIQIVFESETDITLKVSPILYAKDGSVLDDTQQFEHTSTTQASAFIFNSANMTDGTYVKVTVEKDDGSGGWITVGTNMIIDTEPGFNVTHVINFSGADTEDAGISLGYSSEFTENNSGTEIN